MAEPFRIAVIGCGRILAAHLNGYKTLWDYGLRDFRITALCARREEDALAYRRRGEGPPPRPPIRGLEVDPMAAPHLYVSDIHDDALPEIHTDWRALLAERSAELDGVIVLTPHDSHHAIALAAIERGLHVLVEKPLAITVAAGRRMVEAAAERGVVLATAEVVRFHPMMRMAAWCIEQGAIGTVQLVVQLGLGQLWSPSRVRGDTPWRCRKATAGGGPALDMGVHLFHSLEYLCGPIETVAGVAACLEPVRRVFDGPGEPGDEHRCDVEDTFLAQLRFASGAIGTVGHSDALHGQRTAVARTIYGSRGSLCAGRMVSDDGAEETVHHWFSVAADAAVRERFFPHGIQDPFALEHLCWLRSSREGEPCEVGGEVGLRDLAIAHGLLESAERGGEPVAVEAVMRGEVRGYQRDIDQALGLL